MTDIEKAIKGLRCCKHGFCFACPYNDGVDDNVDCKQKWADDALALLKAQTPIEPVRDSWLNWHCGNCRREIDKYEGDVYCPGCGRKVKWD